MQAAAFDAIPQVDISPLFQGACEARDAVDRALDRACREIGFLVVSGLPDDALLSPARRASLLRLFSLPQEAQRRLWRRKFTPEARTLYRGYFPLQKGVAAYKEGIDLGPDPAPAMRHPLIEENPWPAEESLPGWRADVLAYRGAMERVGTALLQSLARALGLAEDHFARAFDQGNGTLRLLHYPPRDAESYIGLDRPYRDHHGASYPIMTREHSDSGCLTLLAQLDQPGLQAENGAGQWIDVPCLPDSLAINLGDLMERWSAGRYRATRHRVLALQNGSRYSLPFFFEPAVDALIEPLPGTGSEAYPAVVYGDYLIEKVKAFPEFSDFLA